jgi:hypothetical protein
MVTDADSITHSRINEHINDKQYKMCLRKYYNNCHTESNYMKHSFTFTTIQILNEFISQHLNTTKQQFKAYLEKHTHTLYHKFINIFNINYNSR